MIRRRATLMLVACAFSVPCQAQETVYEGDPTGVLLLNDSTVAVAEEDRVIIIAPAGRWSLEGPFTKVTRLTRSPSSDLVVWDDSLYAAFELSGSYGRGAKWGVVRFSQPRGIGGGEVSFLGLLNRHVGLFEEVDIGNIFSLSVGPSRNPRRYVAIGTDGTRNVLWQALGKEQAILSTAGGMSSAPIIFGYGVIASNVGDGRFIVGQTELTEAVVVDARGRRLATVPMPSVGPAVTEDQIARERARLIATLDVGPLEQQLRMGMSEEQARQVAAAMTDGSTQALRITTANSIPPRISDLRVDLDQRVWLRRFVPPDATTATWDVHALGGDVGHTVELPAHWVLFDAVADLILVGVRDGTGNVRRVVLGPAHRMTRDLPSCP